MDEDEFEDCEYLAPEAKFSRWDVAVAFMAMFMGIFTAIAGFFELLLQACAMAGNRQMSVDAFAENAGMDIERITAGTDESQ